MNLLKKDELVSLIIYSKHAFFFEDPSLFYIRRKTYNNMSDFEGHLIVFVFVLDNFISLQYRRDVSKKYCEIKDTFHFPFGRDFSSTFA